MKTNFSTELMRTPDERRVCPAEFGCDLRLQGSPKFEPNRLPQRFRRKQKASPRHPNDVSDCIFRRGVFMFSKRWLFTGLVGIVTFGFELQRAQAGDLKITIPRRSKLTPVQRLNREGVEAVRKHEYAKAERLFYRAYLLDTDDAFTLNNLGYISELQGQVDRAQSFYALAAEQSSDAVIDRASARRMEGRPMKEALAVTGQPIQVNHANVEAVRLLSQGRTTEADKLLQDALKTD